MKQIKTIALNCQHDFDEAVNGALQDGWKLTKRRLVQTPAGYTNYYYAELERDDYVPKYASCDNCEHSINDGIPSEAALLRCRGCKQLSRWAPQQEGWKA
jgi:hypothetical protein